MGAAATKHTHTSDGDDSSSIDTQTAAAAPAQRCLAELLSLSLSFLSSPAFAASARSCKRWHAAAQLPSAWPSTPPLLMDAAAQGTAAVSAAYLHAPAFAWSHEHVSSRSLMAGLHDGGTNDRWMVQNDESLAPLVRAATGSLVWRNAVEAHLSRGLKHADSPEAEAQLLAAVAQLPRLRVLQIGRFYTPAQLAPLDALVPRLQVLLCDLRLGAGTVQQAAGGWPAPLCRFTQLRVLSLFATAAPAGCTQLDALLPCLQQLSHLTLRFAQAVPEPGPVLLLARCVALHLRRLSSAHRLRSFTFDVLLPGFLRALTDPPSASNEHAPLAQLTALGHGPTSFDFPPELPNDEQWRALLLPSLTELRAWCPLSQLLPHTNEASPHDFATMHATLGRLQTLVCQSDSAVRVVPRAFLMPLRHCASLRVLIPLTGLPLADVADALEEAAAAASEQRALLGAATSSRAPLLQRLFEIPYSDDLLSALPRFPCLQHLELFCVSRSIDATEALFAALAQLPSFETLVYLSISCCSEITPPMLRSIIRAPRWTALRLSPHQGFMWLESNAHLQALSAHECRGLRHFCVHMCTREGKREWMRAVDGGPIAPIESTASPQQPQPPSPPAHGFRWRGADDQDLVVDRPPSFAIDWLRRAKCAISRNIFSRTWM